MKQIYKILFLLTILWQQIFHAQQIDTVWWSTSNKYTLLSEQNKLSFFPKKGKAIKNVKIHNFNLSTGKIEYLQGGVLHDQIISELKYIAPQANSNYAIFFNSNNYPVIEINPYYYSSPSIENFTSHSIFNSASIASNKKDTDKTKQANSKNDSLITNSKIKTTKDTLRINTQKNISIDSLKTKETTKTDKTDYSKFDVIILVNGKQLFVEIESISDEHISYYRADLLSGPLYTVKRGNASVEFINNKYIIDYYNK